MLTSPPDRGTALNYLVRRLPQITPEEGTPTPSTNEMMLIACHRY